MSGHSLNRPTFETTGRRSGTDTARTSIDFKVNFSGIARLSVMAGRFRRPFGGETLSPTPRSKVNSLTGILFGGQRRHATDTNANPAAHLGCCLKSILAQGFPPRLDGRHLGARRHYKACALPAFS